MVIYITEKDKSHCRAIGLLDQEIPGKLEMSDSEYKEVYARWKNSNPKLDGEELESKIVAHIIWRRARKSPISTKESIELVNTEATVCKFRPSMPIVIPATGSLVRWAMLIVQILILLTLLFGGTLAHGQFSKINNIGFLQGGSAVTDGFFSSPFEFNCAGSLTCTSDGFRLTATGGAGGATAWDDITLPDANLSLNMAAYTTVFTWNATTGASVMFRLTDTLNNTGTGYLFQVDTASGSGVKPVRFTAGGTANGVEMSTAGLLAAIGTGGINATQYKGESGPTATQFSYVDLTSSAQTQLGLKAPLASPTFTGTVTVPTPFTLGAVSVLPTGTELNFVDGVTSAIQTQLDGKEPSGTYSGIGACGANTWASTLNDTATPTCTQPAFSNLSGAATDAQVPNNITIDLATTATTANAGDSATAFFSTGTLEIAVGGTGTGSTLTGLMRGSATAMTAAELSGDVTTSGSNAATVKDNLKISTIGITIDGGGSAITTGVKGYIEVAFACTINRATTLADQSGSIVIDVWKDTYANYPPTVADTITASAKPTITTATKAQDATLTGWTTAVTAGDILGFNVDSAATVTRVHLTLRCVRT